MHCISPKSSCKKMYIFTSVYVRHFEHFVYDYANSSIIICQCLTDENFIIYSSKGH